MGWMNSAGYAARMVGPIWASDLAWRFGGTFRLGEPSRLTHFLIRLPLAVRWYRLPCGALCCSGTASIKLDVVRIEKFLRYVDAGLLRGSHAAP